MGSTGRSTLAILAHELATRANRPIHRIRAVTLVGHAGARYNSRALIRPCVILASRWLDTVSCTDLARAVRTDNIAQLRACYLRGAVVQISHASTAIWASVKPDCYAFHCTVAHVLGTALVKLVQTSQAGTVRTLSVPRRTDFGCSAVLSPFHASACVRAHVGACRIGAGVLVLEAIGKASG